MASVTRDLDARIAHLPGVKAEVRRVGDGIGARARARLAAHRSTGEARVVVEHGSTDTVVALLDPAALSIEFGRAGFTTASGRRVGPMRGLHIVTGAI